MTAFELTSEQKRFVWLHERVVVKWHWLFGGALLRAYTSEGATATISRSALQALIDEGVMRNGYGFDVHIRDKRVAAA